MKFFHQYLLFNEIHTVVDENSKVYGSGKTADEAWSAACSALYAKAAGRSQTDERAQQENQLAADLLSELPILGGAIVPAEYATPTEVKVTAKIKGNYFALLSRDALTRYADSIVRGKATELLRIVAQVGGAIFRKQDVPPSPFPKFCVFIENHEFVHVPAHELDEPHKTLDVAAVLSELTELSRFVNQVRHKINHLLGDVATRTNAEKPAPE